MLEEIVKGGAPIAANRTFACVRRMFNFAVERDIITVTPCTTIKAPSKENQRDRCLSVKEIKAFWKSLDNAPMAVTTKLALKLQLITAQRKGEILSAEWDEINLDTKWWIIPDSKAKNEIQHRVPLSKLAIELLVQLKQLSGESNWVFPSVNGKRSMRGQSVDKALRRCDDIFEKNEIKHFTPHDLRRTAATYMTQIGISRLVVSKILNHVDNHITAIYDRHSYDTEKKDALDLWCNKLKEIIDKDEDNNISTLVA